MTGSGTGTPVTPSGIPTRANLLAQCRAILASATDWPDATINLFIADAIRFYSSEYPRTLRNTITCTAGTQAYNLPGNHDLLRVISVEYPAGQSPPEFLQEAPENGILFYAGDDVYALRGADDDLVNDNYAGQIVLAPTVATGDTFIVTYSATHRIPAADSDPITVPQAHWEALIAFVDFRCHWLMETGEIVVMTSNTITLSQLGQESRMAWNRYKEILDRIAFRQSGQSAVIVWDNSRIY